jgi:hypothetical protein
MLKVMTFLNEMLPALCSSMRVLYTSLGLLPVGRPSTKGFSVVRAWVLIRSTDVSSTSVFRDNTELTDDVTGNILGSRGGLRTNDYFHGGFSVRRKYGQEKMRVRDRISIIDRLASRTCKHISSCLFCCVRPANSASSGYRIRLYGVEFAGDCSEHDLSSHGRVSRMPAIPAKETL